MAELAELGIRPVEPAPSTAKWLVFKRPKGHERSKDYADASTQTGAPEGAEREHCYRVRSPPERSARGIDSATDTYGDLVQRRRREEYRAAWDSERAALRRTAALSGQHEEARGRCNQKAFRGLPREQKMALVVEEDELEGKRREATAESDRLTERATDCGRRPWTPARGRQYERRPALKLAVLVETFPGREAWGRAREQAEQAAAWEQIEEAARAARQRLPFQAPAPPPGYEQWRAPREGQGSCKEGEASPGQGDLEGGGAPLAPDCIINLVRNPAALHLLRREESERRELKGELSVLWADWREESRRLAGQAARLYLMEMIALVDALTGPARVAAEEQSARLQTARGESWERAAALGLREPAERLQLRTAEAAARAELNAEFRAPPVPRPPAAASECPYKPTPYVPPKHFGWWVADSVRRARGWA
eukprot:TRINITY_DN19147_c0_g2_i1.p1 TRINITY_DN19147_c0_g2~~TRINITY_DN19147_c0_g2_i1.p1  ORF type:complete len:427 (+),score=127.77 TRINITY_DN19147_c0_g2_i1:92-1372(+)